MQPSRIHAVDHVHIQAALGLDDELDWFYGELAQLDRLPRDAANAHRMRFQSNRLELRIDLCERPVIEGVACRVVLLMPSLEETVAALEDRSVPFERQSSTVWTDRRVEVLDPAGNRVAFKQEWPFGPL